MEITENDFKRALIKAEKICTEEHKNALIDGKCLLKHDLKADLHMTNGEIASVVCELRHICHVNLPVEIYKISPDDSVGTLISTINQYIREIDAYVKNTPKQQIGSCYGRLLL